MTFAGLPLARWIFALRIWGAVVLALGAAFWLQLDSASSAGVCVAIVAQPTRGQAFEKAFYRTVGTVIGGVVAIVLTDTFAQTRDLYVLAYSLWLGICIFAAGFLDGNRAYGAVLSGYTVSIVTIEQIDLPNQVFSAVVNRCAAIIVGIAAVALVNDLPGMSEIASALSRQVDAARSQVRAFVAGIAITGRRAAIDEQAGALFRAVSGWHPALGALSAEMLTGSHRAASIRAIGTAFIGEVFAARRLAELQGGAEGDRAATEAMLHRQSNDLASCQQAEATAARALHANRRPLRAPGLPIYRPWQNALRNAVRAVLVSTAVGFGFVLTGWPQTAFAWGLVGILICLSATAPEPRNIARTILLALPAAAVLGGVTLFLILDGSDAFPLLCLGLAFPVITGGLLMASPTAKIAGAGTFMTVFVLVVIGAANPQSYDPLSYCITATLVSLAAIIVYASLMTLFPTEDRDRRRWLLDAARRSTRAALQGVGRRPEAEACALDASRIAAISTSTDAPPARQAADLAALFWLADYRAVAQRVWHGVGQLGRDRNAPIDRAALTALRAAVQVGLRQPDGELLRRTAAALATHGNAATRAVGADLALAAHLLEVAPAEEVLAALKP
jgi:uncharacterized membrane protein YccC